MALNPPSIRNSTGRRDFGNPIVQTVLVLVVLVLFSWFLLRPKLSQTLQARSDLSTAQAQLSSIQQDKQDLNTLIDKLHSSQADVTKVDEALPLSGRMSRVYVLMDSLVQSSGMTLALISSDDTGKSISAGNKALLANPYQPGRELHTISLDVTITGTMDQFKNFLQLTETSGRVLDVQSVDVIGGDVLTKFRVKVNAYSYEQLDSNLKANAN